VTYRNGAAAVRRWWDLPAGPPLAMSEEAAAEQLRELLRDSVRMRLIADVPLGVFSAAEWIRVDSGVRGGVFAAHQ